MKYTLVNPGARLARLLCKGGVAPLNECTTTDISCHSQEYRDLRSAGAVLREGEHRKLMSQSLRDSNDTPPSPRRRRNLYVILYYIYD